MTSMTISEFENKWFQKIKDSLLKSFPDDFIENKKFEFLTLPGKPLLKGSELFGTHEIIGTDGIPFLSSDNLDKIKFVLYANRGNPTEIKILENSEELSSIVKKYEKHLDEILKLLVQDFKSNFPESDKFTSTSSKIFQLLNLYRY
jgi:hypothetical protein